MRGVGRGYALPIQTLKFKAKTKFPNIKIISRFSKIFLSILEIIPSCKYFLTHSPKSFRNPIPTLFTWNWHCDDILRSTENSSMFLIDENVSSVIEGFDFQFCRIVEHFVDQVFVQNKAAILIENFEGQRILLEKVLLLILKTQRKTNKGYDLFKGNSWSGKKINSIRIPLFKYPERLKI